MKKVLLLSAVLFGTVAASQAGVHLDIGFRLPLPPLPFPGQIIIRPPTPGYWQREPVCEAPVYAPPVYCPPARRYYRDPSYRYDWSDCDRYDPRGGWGHHGHGNYRHHH